MHAPQLMANFTWTQFTLIYSSVNDSFTRINTEHVIPPTNPVNGFHFLDAQTTTGVGCRGIKSLLSSCT